MTKYLILFSFLICACETNLFSQKLSEKRQIQKPPIPLSVLGHWPSLNSPTISSDGHYVSYLIEQQPEGNQTLIVQACGSPWKKEIIGASNGFFSADNQLFIFEMGDTLCLLKTGTDNIEKISGSKGVKSPDVVKGTILAYQLKSDPNTLILYNLLTGVRRQLQDVGDYTFDNGGHSLIIQSSDSKSIRWVDLEKGSVQTILSAVDSFVSSYSFDQSGSQLALLLSYHNAYSLWYYKTGMANVEQLINNNSLGIDSGIVISNSSPEFSSNGKYIFLKMNYLVENLLHNDNLSPVDVWSYKDVILQSTQMNHIGESNGLLNQMTAVIEVKQNRLIRLERNGERLVTGTDRICSDYAVVRDKENEFWWKKKEEGVSWWLVSLQSGSRKLLSKQTSLTSISFSPGGKYVVYFDMKQKNYFSYDLNKGIIQNITKCISEQLNNGSSLLLQSRKSFPLVGNVSWIGNDQTLLIYDDYDIWQIDPTGVKSPINLTRGYGRRNHIKFRLVHPSKITEGIMTDTLLLTAFNVWTKHNGFYRCCRNKSADPEELSMGPFLFYRDDSQVANGGDAFSSGMQPVKASKANVWITMRQTATESPNYFLTNDFKTFKPITDIQPQREYNWLTTELISWKQLDSTLSQGILYKPENFDPYKKYPLIFNYYETFSFRMYEYPRPYFTTGRMNIAWYVSQGYLVFTPDIYYSTAKSSGKVVGDYAINSVVSAARCLAKMPYVDSKRMAIQGHSFGGGETFFLVSHSKLFAAACAASPTVSDEISAYLSIRTSHGKPGDVFRLDHAEAGHDRIGSTLWQRPDLFIRASPVFEADQVSSPLLIMANEGDESVKWEQGIEMYMALRRLEKKVWLLQYDTKGDGHNVFGKNAMDFTIRLIQFFDHYLKNAPAPVWMTRGIPARLKQIETGYAYDPSNSCGKDCKVCRYWNEKYKKDSAACWKEIEERKVSEHWQ